MQEILDKKLKNKYLKQYQIEKLFDTPDLEFRLYRYEVGEWMNAERLTTKYLKFIVDGKWDIYSVDKNGRTFLIKHADRFALMGDVEFFEGVETGNIQEVKETVYSLELSLDKYRKILLNDNAFLRYLCRTMSQKMYSVMGKALHETLEEQLIHYIWFECEDERMTSIEETAFRLNRSRRQLQRVLKKLVAEGILVKEARGKYRLGLTEKMYK